MLFEVRVSIVCLGSDLGALSECFLELPPPPFFFLPLPSLPCLAVVSCLLLSTRPDPINYRQVWNINKKEKKKS